MKPTVQTNPRLSEVVQAFLADERAAIIAAEKERERKDREETNKLQSHWDDVVSLRARTMEVFEDYLEGMVTVEEVKRACYDDVHFWIELASESPSGPVIRLKIGSWQCTGKPGGFTYTNYIGNVDYPPLNRGWKIPANADRSQFLVGLAECFGRHLARWEANNS